MIAISPASFFLTSPNLKGMGSPGSLCHITSSRSACARPEFLDVMVSRRKFAEWNGGAAQVCAPFHYMPEAFRLRTETRRCLCQGGNHVFSPLSSRCRVAHYSAVCSTFSLSTISFATCCFISIPFIRRVLEYHLHNQTYYSSAAQDPFVSLPVLHR